MRSLLLGLALGAFMLGCDPSQTATDSGAGDGGRTACTSDRTCSAIGLVCDRVNGVCVECVTATDCAMGQVCHAGSCLTVTACTSSRMCPGQVCDTTLGYCVDCVMDVDCSGGMLCRDSLCVAPPPTCASDRDCSAMGLVCDTTLHHCVECFHASDCPTGQFCSTAAATLDTCVSRFCGVNELRCVDATHIAMCTPDGSGFGAPMPCAPGQVCIEGACGGTGFDAGPPVDMGPPDTGPPNDLGALLLHRGWPRPTRGPGHDAPRLDGADGDGPSLSAPRERLADSSEVELAASIVTETTTQRDTELAS